MIPILSDTPRPMLELTAPVIPMSSSFGSPRRGSPRSGAGVGGRHNAQHMVTSQILLERFQAKLAANPQLWMMQEKNVTGVSSEHMCELAIRFKVHFLQCSHSFTLAAPWNVPIDSHRSIDQGPCVGGDGEI